LPVRSFLGLVPEPIVDRRLVRDPLQTQGQVVGVAEDATARRFGEVRAVQNASIEGLQAHIDGVWGAVELRA
jgi:hypothetical protein